MLMAVCQESNFGIPIQIDNCLQVQQLQTVVEDDDPQTHTLDFNLIESEVTEVVPSDIPEVSTLVPTSYEANTSNNDNNSQANLQKNSRKRRSRPYDPYYDLLSQIRRDTNRVHLTFQRQGDQICQLLSELKDALNQ
ncbi:hypothetical protein CHUAL_006921 [Chamberlinius hualienensis]